MNINASWSYVFTNIIIGSCFNCTSLKHEFEMFNINIKLEKVPQEKAKTKSRNII